MTTAPSSALPVVTKSSSPPTSPSKTATSAAPSIPRIRRPPLPRPRPQRPRRHGSHPARRIPLPRSARKYARRKIRPPLDRLASSAACVSSGRIHNVPLAGGDTSESPSRSHPRRHHPPRLRPRGRALRRSEPAPATPSTSPASSAEQPPNSPDYPQSRKRRTPLPATTDDHPHLFPEPRLDTGEALLRRNLATACIDISDGLSTDLAHLCRASASTPKSSKPQSPSTHSPETHPAGALKSALHGGEDYELLFTAAPKLRMPSSLAGVPITRIGYHHTQKPPQTPHDPHRPRRHPHPTQPAGWEHFTDHA